MGFPRNRWRATRCDKQTGVLQEGEARAMRWPVRLLGTLNRTHKPQPLEGRQKHRHLAGEARGVDIAIRVGF